MVPEEASEGCRTYSNKVMRGLLQPRTILSRCMIRRQDASWSAKRKRSNHRRKWSPCAAGCSDFVVFAHLFRVVTLVESSQHIFPDNWLVFSLFSPESPLYTHKYWASCIHTHHTPPVFTAGKLERCVFSVSDPKNRYRFPLHISTKVVIVGQLVVLTARDVRELW